MHNSDITEKSARVSTHVYLVIHKLLLTDKLLPLLNIFTYLRMIILESK